MKKKRRKPKTKEKKGRKKMAEVSHRDHVDAHDQVTSKLSASIQALKAVKQREDALKAENATLKSENAGLREEVGRLLKENSDWKEEHVRNKEAMQKHMDELDALLGG
ncbi:MAG: hypothetical protein FJZ43_02275 [Candidatus Staskawiczbacteria bacterium]|nr:hypothetical protein [Candidatus Staskawiczbacteria bacterium]